MAVRNGQVDTANQLVGLKQDMDEGIRIMDPVDVPLQQWLPTDTTDSIKVEWMEEGLTPSTLTCVSKTGSGPWVMTVSATDDDVVRPGDVLHEVNGAATLQWYVTSIDRVANTVNITGFASNTTAPTDSAVLEIIGQYRDEGADPEEARSVDRTDKYNYTQWGQESVERTRTARKQARFAGGDPLDHEKAKKFKELAIRFERSAIHGQRVKSSDAKKRFMGGLFYFITGNSRSGVAANVKTLIGSLIRDVNEDGGMVGGDSILMTSFAVKEAIDANIDPTLRRWTMEDKHWGVEIERISTSFGDVHIMPNRHFPKTKGLLLNRTDLARVNYDPYFYEELAQTGDRKEGHIVGEFTMRVKNPNAHGILTVTDAA